MDEGDNLILLDGEDGDGEELWGWGASFSCEDNAQVVLGIAVLDGGLDTVESPDRGELDVEGASERSE